MKKLLQTYREKMKKNRQEPRSRADCLLVDRGRVTRETKGSITGYVGEGSPPPFNRIPF